MQQASWFASSRSNEWYTNREMVDRVISVLGVIDLDPCSNPPPYNVPATLHYTSRENGLTQPWHGKVFCNPPYSAMPSWMAKLAREVREGHTAEAIALVPARTETRWFLTMWEADALCFWFNRLYFLGGTGGRSPFASVVGYFGRRRKRFTEVFGEVGKIVYPKVV
jgi:DNA N-6-adenine-methyltransferase (Dam)